ncbi:hypothetical protein [Pectobacterium parvum]|uniref:hypothetical protein n=1 Tax=Pectobacterium parvum TaxID=2778550 RepID=UPI0021CAB801|nr:hypothetical protein [Pectobacterium parvum]MCU1803434.1 hypothetical protein [Pectobacterium parvum]
MNWSLSAFCYFYFVFVGVCYLLGFWIPLHFNVLEFMSPVDIIKSATYPLIPAALGVFFWVLMDSYNSKGTRKPEDDDPKIIKILFWLILSLGIMLTLMTIFSLSIYLYNLFITEPEKKISYALPIASMVSIFYFLHNPPFLIDKEKLIRNFVIIFTCTLPTISYFQGSKNITNLLEGSSDFYYLKISSKNCLVDKKSKIIYLGYFSGNYFFVNSINKDICIEKDGGVLLSFNKNKERDHDENIREAEASSNKEIH